MDKIITTTGKETKMKIETYIKKELRKVSWMAWLIGLIPVPVGIVNASLLSRLVSLAVEGNVKDVLITGAGNYRPCFCCKISSLYFKNQI